MDCRDFAGKYKWYEALDQKTMQASVKIIGQDDDLISEENDYGDFERIIQVPFKYEVCNVCGGKGSYVNPNIDRHGLSHEDFDNDPDFAESYFSGSYDVSCRECSGTRVCPVFNEELASDEVKKLMKDHQNYISQCYQEARSDAHTRFMESGGYGY